MTGKTIAAAAQILGISVPSQVTLYASNPRLQGGQFAVEANVISGFQYLLWRALGMPAPIWQPVTNAIVLTEGSAVTLIDTNWPAPELNYRTSTKPGAGPGSN